MHILLAKPCPQVTGNTPVAHGIGTVWRKAYFKNFVFLNAEYFMAWRTGLKLFIKHHNAIMAFSQPKFIFGTNHTVAVFATYLSFLYLECVAFFIIKGCAYCCYRNFLPHSHIWRPANNLYRNSVAQVNCCNSKPVGIRVLYAGKYMPYHNTFKPAFKRLKLVNSLHFKAKIC